MLAGNAFHATGPEIENARSPSQMSVYCYYSVRVCLCDSPVVFWQRSETLLVEYKKLGRSNKTVDHRIGENDPTMSFDEKMAKRFALERRVRDVVCVL